MPVYARREIVAEGEVGMYHCLARCVRRAFLCGQDPLSGRNFEHRKQWMQSRLEELAGIMAIDVCGFSIMSNHFHVVLRQRPDVAQAWTDEEVARRWWRLFPRRRDASGAAAQPHEHELKFLMASEAGIAERRKRLANLSWFMRCVSEPIARRANAEDQVGGRFWGGRFKSVALLDEAAILACSVYVDLNPIRAGIAETPETSRFTSVHERIKGLSQSFARRKQITGKQSPAADGWLCPVPEAGNERPTAEQAPRTEPLVAAKRTKAPSESKQRLPVRRASESGFLPLSLENYLKIVDWTGRQVRQDKRGAIPSDVLPILQRLAIDTETWVESVKHFGRLFHRAAGRTANMAARAAQAGKRWFAGVSSAKAAFG